MCCTALAVKRAQAAWQRCTTVAKKPPDLGSPQGWATPPLLFCSHEFHQHPQLPPPTTELVPLILGAAKRGKMSRSFTDNINSFNVSNVSSVSNVLNVSNHYPAAEDRSEILTWLSPLEPRIRHQDLRTRRADNVGEWLLQTEEFRGWCGGAQQEGAERATLFCCGDPAVGKTYFR